MNTKANAEVTFKRDQLALLKWYQKQKRDLPWRLNRDAYRIWVSEVMLQQTTVAAVVPFYERFMKRFPNVKSLAESSLETVLENWAGLGYYSRACNLHRSAQLLAENGFPETYLELLEFPGFGPYTARAVSSQAFNERTGVLDGNVIRVLTRRYGLDLEWWKPSARTELQALSDQLADVATPSDLNQGLMELGAMVCTPQNPACLLCPWVHVCVARNAGEIARYPKMRPRRAREVWVWKPELIERNGKIALVENDYAPFLKGQWIFPGTVERKSTAPRKFSYRHSVTHHDIFVMLQKPKTFKLKTQNIRWVERQKLRQVNPASLLIKALQLD
jgi:A/G-specific adenine glycosylase